MELIETVHLRCPYCGAALDTTVDTSAGSQDYIEDCRVCCQPIEVHTEIDLPGLPARVSVQRGDA